VISIDIAPISPDYPRHPRLTYLGGRPSTDPQVVKEVSDRIGARRAMIILDSDHSQANVEAELEAYSELVATGCYLIVEDTNIGIVARHDRPGPREAVEAFLEQPRGFEVDVDREKFMITFNPGGYLRRTR
jgi:cephalosporin hydroxylase